MAKDIIAALRARAEPYLTLDPEKGREANPWADIGAGMLPGIGTVQAGRDFERARRESDPLGMGLAALAAVPIAGKPVATVAKALRKGAKAAGAASKAAEPAQDMVTLYRAQIRGKPIKNWFTEDKSLVDEYYGMYSPEPGGVDLYQVEVPFDDYDKYIMKTQNRPDRMAEGFGASREVYIPRSVAQSARVVNPADVLPSASRAKRR